MTVSNGRPISADGTPDATDAFMIRAPSRCRLSSSSRAVATTASISAGRQNRPPDALWVFSTETIPVRGVCVASPARTVSRICSGVKRPASQRSGRVIRPANTAGPPSSEMKMCEFSSAMTSSPGSRERPQRDLVRHRRRRDEDRLLLPEQLRRAALELVHGRVLAPLLVADLGRGDRRAHLRARLRLRVRAEVDHHAPFDASTAGSGSAARSGWSSKW